MITAGFRVLTCADAGFFHFLPTLEKNIFAQQGEYPVIYDIGMTEEQVAQLKSEVIKIAPPKGFSGSSSSGALKASHKPRCVKHFLEHSDRDVLYIDADVIILEALEDIEFTGGDIAVTPRHPKEMRSKDPYLNGTLNSGVIFFRNIPGVVKIVDLWETECSNDEKSDQMALSDVLIDADIKDGPGTGRAHGLNILKLPAIKYNDVSYSIGKLWHFKNAGRYSSLQRKRSVVIFVSRYLPRVMAWWLSRNRQKSEWTDSPN